MKNRRKIVAIPGSTRAASTNLDLIKAIIELSGERFDFTVFYRLAGIPHFNPDLDGDHPPVAVENFRNMLRQSRGILICTPEYAMGVPGTLKNAIDWTVSSMEFRNRPTALITASTLGYQGHSSLLETLKIIGARVTGQTQLLIPHAKTKISGDHTITDPGTLEQVMALMYEFERIIDFPGT